MFAYLNTMWELASQGDLEGIWFWVCVYVLITFGYSVFYQLRVRKWPAVTGTLHQATVSKIGATKPNPSDQYYHANVYYTYTVQGTEYSGRRVSPWVLLVSKNLRALPNLQLKQVAASNRGLVNVFYNPNAPHKSYLVLPSRVGLAVTCMLGVLPAIGFLSKFYY